MQANQKEVDIVWLLLNFRKLPSYASAENYC